MDPLVEHHLYNIANNKAVKNEDGTLSTVRAAIVEIDGIQTLIPTIWDGEEVDIETAIQNAQKSGVNWQRAFGDNAVEILRDIEIEGKKEMSDQTTPEEAQSRLDSYYEDIKGFALGGIAAARKGITTQEGRDMAAKKFQLDEKKADLNNDGDLSDYERNRGEAIQKSLLEQDEDKVEMAHGGMACGCDDEMSDGLLDYDPVSGNPIPIGASAHNVRDDIEAMISEGEYILPAHVVNWHGLKHIQMMQSEAEMGLMAMQMDGLIQYVDEEKSHSQSSSDTEVSDEDDTEQEETEEEGEASEEIPSEEMDIEVATIKVDDQLDDTEDIEEILPVSKTLPGMLKKQKIAFMV
jgi:hypothetical protein